MRPSSSVFLALTGAALLAAPAAAQRRNAAAAPAAAPAATAPVRPAPASWTSDQRELAVGDIITLYVNDALIASARRTQNGRDANDRDLGMSVSPPGGAEPIAGGFNSSRRANSDQSGDMSRTSALRTTVPVRITARNADGSYQVSGTRALNIDKNQQEISVQGILRPQDVTVHNEADGDRLADAKIAVKQKGRLGKTRGGIIGRVVGLIWP